LTATSLGKATGTVGVDVIVGGGVAEGGDVCVKVTVGTDRVAVGLTVGVPVTGALDGRLQADRVKTGTNIKNKLRNFIEFSFDWCLLSYAEIPKMAMVKQVPTGTSWCITPGGSTLFGCPWDYFRMG
jgi:hypothetical protein